MYKNDHCWHLSTRTDREFDLLYQWPEEQATVRQVYNVADSVFLTIKHGVDLRLFRTNVDE